MFHTYTKSINFFCFLILHVWIKEYMRKEFWVKDSDIFQIE